MTAPQDKDRPDAYVAVAIEVDKRGVVKVLWTTELQTEQINTPSGCRLLLDLEPARHHVEGADGLVCVDVALPGLEKTIRLQLSPDDFIREAKENVS